MVYRPGMAPGNPFNTLGGDPLGVDPFGATDLDGVYGPGPVAGRTPGTGPVAPRGYGPEARLAALGLGEGAPDLPEPTPAAELFPVPDTAGMPPRAVEVVRHPRAHILGSEQYVFVSRLAEGKPPSAEQRDFMTRRGVRPDDQRIQEGATDVRQADELALHTLTLAEARGVHQRVEDTTRGRIDQQVSTVLDEMRRTGQPLGQADVRKLQEQSRRLANASGAQAGRQVTQMSVEDRLAAFGTEEAAVTRDYTAAFYKAHAETLKGCGLLDDDIARGGEGLRIAANRIRLRLRLHPARTGAKLPGAPGEFVFSPGIEDLQRDLDTLQAHYTAYREGLVDRLLTPVLKRIQERQTVRGAQPGAAEAAQLAGVLPTNGPIYLGQVYRRAGLSVDEARAALDYLVATGDLDPARIWGSNQPATGPGPATAPSSLPAAVPPQAVAPAVSPLPQPRRPQQVTAPASPPPPVTPRAARPERQGDQLSAVEWGVLTQLLEDGRETAQWPVVERLLRDIHPDDPDAELTSRDEIEAAIRHLEAEGLITVREETSPELALTRNVLARTDRATELMVGQVAEHLSEPLAPNEQLVWETVRAEGPEGLRELLHAPYDGSMPDDWSTDTWQYGVDAAARTLADLGYINIMESGADYFDITYGATRLGDAAWNHLNSGQQNSNFDQLQFSSVEAFLFEPARHDTEIYTGALAYRLGLEYTQTTAILNQMVADGRLIRVTDHDNHTVYRRRS